MAKILAITPESISIGMDDGSLKEVPASSVNFVPHVGDEVEVFVSATNTIVSKVEKNPPVQQPIQQPVQQPMQQPNIIINNANTNVNTNNNMGNGRAKNKWVALLLCFFLGILGAHKFYEGKIGMGVLYIFTVGLFGIGVIIDFFAILFKPNPYYV